MTFETRQVKGIFRNKCRPKVGSIIRASIQRREFPHQILSSKMELNMEDVIADW